VSAAVIRTLERAAVARFKERKKKKRKKESK
jgi:hypothetical protein